MVWGQEKWRKMAEKMRRTFHPDMWRARNILGAVFDEEDRTAMEQAGNRVSQAINTHLM